MVRITFLVLGLLLIIVSASAQSGIYALDPGYNGSDDDQLLKVNTQTGKATTIGRIRYGDVTRGLGYDSNRRRLLASGRSRDDEGSYIYSLLSINRTTGRGTAIAPLESLISGMSFDPQSGKFYVLYENHGNTLGLLNTDTGEIDEIGEMTGVGDAEGIALDPKTRQLFVSDRYSSPDRLFRVSRSSARATWVGPLNSNDLAIAYDPLRRILFGISSFGPDQLLLIDPQTGNESRLGALGDAVITGVTDFVYLPGGNPGDVISISGRILDRQTGLPLSGVVIEIAEETGTTDDLGQFGFSFNPANGTTLMASQIGFLPLAQAVDVPAGRRSINVGDLFLAPESSSPVIESAKFDMNGIFLRGFGLIPNLQTKVNWNGNTPSHITVQVNGVNLRTITEEGPQYQVPISVDEDLELTTDPIGNRVSITATSSSGNISEPFELNVVVVDIPAGLRSVVDSELFTIFGPDQVGFDFELTKLEKKIELPLIGTFGFDFGANASFDYTLSDGSWETAIGLGAEGKQGKRGRRPKFPGFTRFPKAKLYIGNREINVSLDGKAFGTATQARGIRLEKVELSAGLSARLELTRFGLLDIFGPGLTNAVSDIPKVGDKLKNISVIVWFIPSLDGSGTASISPFDFEEATLTGKIAVEGVWEPKFKNLASAKFYVGSDITTTFGTPDPLFRDVRFRLYAGYDFTVWIFSKKDEVIFLTYPDPDPENTPTSAFQMKSIRSEEEDWALINRDWRDRGEEVFLPGQMEERSASASEAATFASMGSKSTRGGVAPPQSSGGDKGAAESQLDSSPDFALSNSVQTELPLLENVYPESDPSLSAHEQDLMLLYVRDTGANDPVHFTEIAFTAFDGAAWSSPEAVAEDTRGQFEPDVSFDGNGRAVAVWAQIKDAEYEGTELDTMAAQLEIMSSYRNAVTGEWSNAVPLTNNQFLDHKPIINGPLSDGDLILTWRENQGNFLVGENTPDSLGATNILTRRWDAESETWGETSALAVGLENEFSIEMAATGEAALLVLDRDMDGDLTDSSDSEIFTATFDSMTDAWSPLARMTDDQQDDRNAQVAIDEEGNVHLIWQRGSELVMDTNFSGTPQIVRANSDSLGFSEYAASAGPGRNLVLVWQEMNAHGADVHYRVYDPNSDSWGLDTLLSKNSNLERNFSVVWDAAGNLTLAYNRVEIVKERKTVMTDEGDAVEVEGVPQPGRVDLLVAKRALVRDVRMKEGSLTPDNLDFSPGDEVGIQATVENTGNASLQDMEVTFFEGNPEEGGSLIETVTVSGWLRASEETEASTVWTVSENSSENEIFAVVDHSDSIAEFDESNNAISAIVRGPDLSLQLASSSVLRDGSVHIVARISNFGTLVSVPSELQLFRAESEVPDKTVLVGQLDPGASAELAFVLPPGSHDEGVSEYSLIVATFTPTADLDTANNGSRFSLNLWIDDDGDKIPNIWEEENGMDDEVADDASSDFDGDGFSAYEEYLSGTDPRDGRSFLRLSEFHILSGNGNSGKAFTFSWPSQEGRSYRVERSYDMETWETVSDDIEATPPLNSLSDQFLLDAPRAFYRIILK